MIEEVKKQGMKQETQYLKEITEEDEEEEVEEKEEEKVRKVQIKSYAEDYQEARVVEEFEIEENYIKVAKLYEDSMRVGSEMGEEERAAKRKCKDVRL